MCDLLNASVSLKQISRIVGVSEKTVYNVKKKMIMSKTITRKTGSGGSNKKCSKTFIKTLKSKIQKDPTKSMQKVERELKVDSKTFKNSVKYDLKLKSYTRTPKHLLTTAMKEKSLERCKKITTWLKKNPSIVMIILNEKVKVSFLMLSLVIKYCKFCFPLCIFFKSYNT